MMKTMKRAELLIAILCAVCAIGAQAADLHQIQSVYLLQMGNGLDQYLANHLTTNGVLKVVTDPEKAEAILTDEIGLRFEQRLEELYPPPPEEPEPTAEGEEDDATEPEAEDDFFAGLEQRPRLSTFSRGKGNVFLVDRASRRVVWSMFHQPKDGTPKELNRAAKAIVTNLKGALGGL